MSVKLPLEKQRIEREGEGTEEGGGGGGGGEDGDSLMLNKGWYFK